MPHPRSPPRSRQVASGLARIIHDPSSRGDGVCVRFAALGPEGAEGVPVGTSRDPEGEGREDGAQYVPAAEGFMNSPGEKISETLTEPECEIRPAGKARNHRHSRRYGEVSQRSQRAADRALATEGFLRWLLD